MVLNVVGLIGVFIDMCMVWCSWLLLLLILIVCGNVLVLV